MISKFLGRVSNFLSQPAAFGLFLLAVCAAAYAPMITRLGFYWDDFPISWIASTMGGDGLTRYFSTNRPVWGLVYRVTTAFLGSAPLTWQIFGLLMRWITGLALWVLLRLVWKDRAQFAAWAAVLFVLYPGFSQQFIAFMYSHFFIILASLLLSLMLTMLALRNPRWYWPLTAAAGLLSLLNLLAMEYFFLLDLLRPALIWIVLSETIPDWRKRLQRTLLIWLPYLAIFGGAMFWRSVLFGFQTYQPALMSRLRSQPIQALADLIPIIFKDLWITSAGAWAKAFTIPTAPTMRLANLQRYWLFVAGSSVAAGLFLFFYRPAEPDPKKNWAIQPVLLGLLALFIAGGPFWLTDLGVALVYPGDRFTLPFMLGASLILAGFFAWSPGPRWVKPALLGVVIGFAVGLHFQSAIVYNLDWSVQRNLFWQMTWRIPDMQPGTTLLSNELPVTHYTDNSLSAPLNWIYDTKTDPLVMKYILFYPTLRRADTIGNFQPHASIKRDYLAATFYGSTDQMITLYYQPPGCLRILDPQVEQSNWMVPGYLRETLWLSTTAPILSAPAPGKPQPHLPETVFGSEISHGWCYYYEKADLARQFKQWETVAALGDEAFSGSDYPNDPIERFPFIEGYAHVGNWLRAIELSEEALAVTPVSKPMLCALWSRIKQETLPSMQQAEALESVQGKFACPVE